MAEQYFTAHPTAQHDQHTFDFTLSGHVFHFLTDSGVFAKGTIDYGTRVLLQTLDFDQLPVGHILDLGCGYGPIGLTVASEQPQRQVDLVDINQRALELARKNALRNQLTNIHVFASDSYQQVTITDYAAIYTNPPLRAGKVVVTTMITQAKDHLQRQGQFWLVVQKKQGAPSYQKIMQHTFGNAQIIKRDKGYYIIKSVKTEN